MHDRLRIDYLATFDTGNASIRWPQKNAKKANGEQYLFDREMRNTIKLNLLLKPFISIRHFELFDNLALAKFISGHRQVIKRMSEAGLIRICSRLSSSWEEICTGWALQNSQEPMHWHHLTPKRQQLYDLASKKETILGLKSMEAYLWLPEHEDPNGHPLNLNEMVATYDELFPPHRIIATDLSSSPRRTYSELVEQELDRYLAERRQLEGRLPAVVSRIEETIRKCCELGVRRREFYTKVEGLHHELAAESGHMPKNLGDEVAALKAFVINEAFYQEIQRFDRFKCGSDYGNAQIVANRDITKPLVPDEGKLVGFSSPQDIADLMERETLPVLDAISMEDILDWHTASHAEATSFRSSLSNLQELCATQRALDNEPAVSACMHQHIENIRACTKRSFSANGKTDMLEAPWTEVYFGLNPDIGTGAVVAGLVTLARHFSLATDLLAALSAGYSTVLFRKRAKSYLIEHFETTLENNFKEGIGGDRDVG